MQSPISRTTWFKLNDDRTELLLGRKNNVLRKAVNPCLVDMCVSCEINPAMPSTNFQLCYFCVQRHCRYPDCLEESPRKCEICRHRVCALHSEIHESVIAGNSVYFATCISCSNESPPLFACQPLSVADLPKPDNNVCNKMESNDKIKKDVFEFIKNKI